MSGWKEANLSDYVQFSTKKINAENVPLERYISTDNLIPNLGGVELAKSLPNQSKYVLFQKGDVLFSNIRTYFKKVWKAEFEGGCSNDVIVFKAIDENDIDQDFVYYVISNNAFIDYTSFTAKGTKMPRGDKEAIKKYSFLLPDIEEQKQIAKTLSNLDQKITLLRQQNKTLEELAQTLFTQWFVQESDPTWDFVILSDVANIFIGRTPPRKEEEWFSRNEKDVKWVSIKDLGENGVYISQTSEYLTQEAVDKFKIPVIEPNTVLLSFKMTLGRVGITTGKMLSNEAIAQFRIKEDSNLSPEFLYFFLKTFKYQNLGSTSSIVTSINSGMIKDIPMVLPDKNTLIKFSNTAKPLFYKIRSNSKEIQTLTQLRDTLLPKLMSGEVKINV